MSGRTTFTIVGVALVTAVTSGLAIVGRPAAAVPELVAIDEAVAREGRTRARTRPEPLRERFRQEFEQAAMGDARKEEGIGERGGFDQWFYDQRAYLVARSPREP